jgi:hypothetical protein
MQLEMSSTKVMCSHIPTISFASTQSLAHLWSLASHNPAEIKAISRIRCDVARDTGIAI